MAAYQQHLKEQAKLKSRAAAHKKLLKKQQQEYLKAALPEKGVRLAPGLCMVSYMDDVPCDSLSNNAHDCMTLAQYMAKHWNPVPGVGNP